MYVDVYTYIDVSSTCIYICILIILYMYVYM